MSESLLERSGLVLSGILGFSLIAYFLLIGVSVLTDPLLWLGVLLAVLAYLTARFSNSIVQWDRAWLIVASLAVAPFILVFVFYMGVLVPVNYPPGYEFEETLVPETPSEQAEANFRHINEEFRAWSTHYDSQVEQIEESSLAPPDTGPTLRELAQRPELTSATAELANRTADSRSEIISVLIERPFARPKSEWGIDGDLMQVLDILALNRLEIIAVKQRLAEGRAEAGARRYRRLWRAIHSLNESASSIMSLIVSQAAFDKLIHTYGEHPSLRAALDPSFLDLVRDSQSIQAPAGRSALAHEYVAMKDATRQLARDTLALRTNTVVKDLVTLFARWPLFDVERTQWRFHEFYVGLARYMKPEFHQRVVEFGRFQRRWIGRARQWRLTRPWNMMTNPIGRFLMTRGIPNLRDLVVNRARLRSRMTMVTFAAENTPPYDRMEPPTDELTGETYRVETHSDSYVLRSGYTGRVQDDLLNLTVVTD